MNKARVQEIRNDLIAALEGDASHEDMVDALHASLDLTGYLLEVEERRDSRKASLEAVIITKRLLQRRGLDPENYDIPGLALSGIDMDDEECALIPQPLFYDMAEAEFRYED